MRIHDLIKEEKQQQPEVKLTQAQLYEKRLKEALDNHREQSESKHVTK